MCHSGRTRIAVGFFDGVHLGHREILSRADIAVTFRRHPLEVISPAAAPALILTPEERVSAIRGAGVEKVEMLDFDSALAEMSAESFIGLLKEISLERCGSDEIEVSCGTDWKFGKGGEDGRALLSRHAIGVRVVPFKEYAGGKISSTRIRNAIENGRFDDASAMLGREYRVSGEVFKGKGEGGGIGFPTVNVRPAAAEGSRMASPPVGVYAVDCGGVLSLANFGVAPTMGERSWKSPVWELHFPCGAPPDGFAIDGKVSFRPVRFLREEKKFSSIEELRRQIAADCKEVCG